MSGKSTRVRISRLNGPQGGGPKKTGLAPLTNSPSSVVRYLRMRGVTSLTTRSGPSSSAPSSSGPSSLILITQPLITPPDQENITNDNYVVVTTYVPPSMPIFFPSTGANGGNFSNQVELNELGGTTKINGNLIISGFTIPPDFSVFNNLTEISGNLQIINNVGLEIISGFPNLSTIRGNFDILNNNKLRTISSSSFSSLVSVTNDFTIYNNGVHVSGTFIVDNVSTTISSTFASLRATPSKGIGGTTIITGADDEHKTSITSAALEKITAASTNTPIITGFLFVVS